MSEHARRSRADLEAALEVTQRDLATTRRELALEVARRVHRLPDDLAYLLHGDNPDAFDGQARRLAEFARSRAQTE